MTPRGGRKPDRQLGMLKSRQSQAPHAPIVAGSTGGASSYLGSQPLQRLDEDVDRFTMHARALGSVIASLTDRGWDTARIHYALRQSGLHNADPDAFDGYISVNRFAGLLESLATATGDPHFGLKLASYLDPEALGVLGALVMNAPTLGDALDMLARYMRLYADLAVARVVMTDHRAEFVWSHSPLIIVSDQLVDRSAALALAFLRGHLPDGWRPDEVRLQRPPPANRAAYYERLGPKIRFDCPHCAVAFPRAALTRSSPRANRYAFEGLKQLAERMLGERRAPDDFSIRVREDVISHLADRGPSLADTARRLGLSPRSLQRRLEAFGTSFQDLCEEIRIALAKELLTQTTMPMSEVAIRLGFANQANLTRAIKRWFGASPRAVRADSALDTAHTMLGQGSLTVDDKKMTLKEKPT